MCLSDVRRGQMVRIEYIEDEDLRSMLIRFGLGEGSSISCTAKIPLGPLTIRHRRQEIAIGRQAAGRIRVTAGGAR